MCLTPAQALYYNIYALIAVLKVQQCNSSICQRLMIVGGHLHVTFWPVLQEQLGVASDLKFQVLLQSRTLTKYWQKL